MEDKNIKGKLKNQTTGYLMAAFGLVAGLAWNDAIKSAIEYFYPFSNGSIWLKFIYAILITVAVVIIGHYVVKTPE